MRGYGWRNWPTFLQQYANAKIKINTDTGIAVTNFDGACGINVWRFDEQGIEEIELVNAVPDENGKPDSEEIDRIMDRIVGLNQ